jgi:hypothetical protein
MNVPERDYLTSRAAQLSVTTSESPTRR